MTSFWSVWVSIITLGSIFGCLWILFAVQKSQKHNDTTEETTGHVYDGIEELDNPMPKWWIQLFVITSIFSLVYLVLYPGLGNYQGLLGWTSTGHWEQEVKDADEKYNPIFEAYAQLPIETLSKDTEAMKVGQRLFATNCSVCHGSTGRGSLGFPNLTDNDWIHGGSPETIKTTILEGRKGQMPAKGFKPTMSKSDVNNLTHYLLSFSQRSDDTQAIEHGSKMFQTACAGCHGKDAKGNQSAGAPNLTDNTWLYGSTYTLINQTINFGRSGVMPAQADKLSEDKIHLLAAYVYSLSNK